MNFVYNRTVKSRGRGTSRTKQSSSNVRVVRKQQKLIGKMHAYTLATAASRERERKSLTPPGSRSVIVAYLVFPASPPPSHLCAGLMPQVSFGKQRSSRLFRFYLSSPAAPFPALAFSPRLSSPNALSGQRFLPPSPPLPLPATARNP